MLKQRGIADGLRSRRFEEQCERLRPLGHSFVLRRFSGQLNREDAEDAVAEVIIRLHEHARDGHRPDNLRAAFFTSVRNQAIDLLRARGARPTEVTLEAVLDAPGDGIEPSDEAESREEAAVLREAIGRMRANYREAIVLRFGAGLTVPEIAEHKGISLPAAKKLILKATRQVKDKLLAVTSPAHCEEMQDLVERSLFEKYASGIASDEEATQLRQHLDHCGHCKGFLVSLHQGLHEVATGALFATAAADQLTGKAGVVDHLTGFAQSASDSSQAVAEKARLTTFKLSNAIQGGESGVGGALAGTGQKVAAVCAAGATATCVGAGVVGPGVGGVDVVKPGEDQTSAIERPADESPAPVAVDPPETLATTPPPSSDQPSPTPKPAQQLENEVGFEASAPSGGGSSSGGEFGGPSGGGGGAGGGSGGGGFGFER